MSYGPSFFKKSLWDGEYSTSKWSFNDNTTDDFVYPYLEKWARKGSILDLGCGSGNTSNELADSAYTSYLGVDISDVALAKARRWTEQNGRTSKNKFVQGELLSYVPPQRFDVILFRESMYHVPLGKVKPVLEHYANYLTPEGVIIVRMSKTEHGKPKWRPTSMFRVIETEFEVVEQGESAVGFGGTVMVFRPKYPCERFDSALREQGSEDGGLCKAATLVCRKASHSRGSRSGHPRDSALTDAYGP